MKISFLTFVLLFIFNFSALAQEPTVQQPAEKTKSNGESFTVYVENDTQRMGGPNTDQGYTSGVRFSYVFAEDRVPDWIPNLASSSETLQKEFKKSNTNFGVSIAQQIYTPINTDKTEFIPDDRPYAGWLYLGFTANFKTLTHSHSLELDIGVVGPEAMGEAAQNGFHRIIGIDEAKGWAHQLPTEPTLHLAYTQKIRFFELKTPADRTLDLIPYYGGHFGNVLIAAHAGALIRAGVRLPDDFGPSRLSSANSEAIINNKSIFSLANWRIYGFAGVRGNAIVRNLFLDGNTFRESHRVKKYPFTVETEFGYAIQVTNWSYAWRFVTVSPEYEQRSEFNSYASMSLSYIKDF